MATDAASRSRFALYLDLIRWDRPAGTYLLLWPTLSALWIAAGGFPGWRPLVVFVLGTFLMRSAGCAVNDVADREFDRHVKRTANRPVTSGAIAPREALALGAALALAAFGLVLTTNPTAIAWSFAALAIALLPAGLSSPVSFLADYLPEVLAAAWLAASAFLLLRDHAAAWVLFGLIALGGRGAVELLAQPAPPDRRAGAWAVVLLAVAGVALLAGRRDRDEAEIALEIPPAPTLTNPNLPSHPSPPGSSWTPANMSRSRPRPSAMPGQHLWLRWSTVAIRPGCTARGRVRRRRGSPVRERPAVARPARGARPWRAAPRLPSLRPGSPGPAPVR